MASPQLARAFRARMNTIRAATVAAALARWDVLDEWRDAQARTFAPAVASLTEAGQRRAALLTGAYLARSSGESITVDPAAHTGPAVRAGTESTEVFTRPFHSVWTALSEGRGLEAAVAAGRAQVGANASVAVQLAMRSAADDVLGQSSRIVGYRRTLTGRSCGFCATASTQRYHRGDLMPLHHNCVPEGSLVSVPPSPGAETADLAGVEAATRRRYAGDLTVLRTASGDELAVTPNHPVLTDRGWVPAQFVGEGDHLLRHSSVQRERGRGPHEGHRPALVEDVWGALSVMGGLVRVPLAAEDFHGDGADGEVDVVRPHGDLATEADLELFEPAGQQLLVGGHLGRVGLPGPRPPRPLLEAVGPAPGGGVGGGGLGLALAGGHAGCTHTPGVAAAPRFDAPAEQFSPQSAAVYAERGLDLQRRLAGEVVPDRVVEHHRVGFRGHVYNLNTVGGWYTAGCYVVSNCDCGIAPIIGTRDPGRVLNDGLLSDLKAQGPRYWQARHFQVDEDGSLVLPDVAVRDHGELGPVLTGAGHEFTEI